jgi:hypothetical protein
MTTLKLQYRIRVLRLLRQGADRFRVLIRNSPALTIPVFAVRLRTHRTGGRPEARTTRHAPGSSLRGVTTLITRSTPTSRTPAVPLTAAGYTDPRGHLDDLGATAFRPNWVQAILRGRLPSLRRLEKSRWRGVRQAAGAALGKSRSLGKVEHRLKQRVSNSPSGLWHAGHLVGNQFGGPAAQWNMVPMTRNLNTQAFGAAENWLRAQFRLIRDRKAHATVRFKVNATDYQGDYSRSKSSILRAGFQDSGHGAANVTIPSFVPAGITAEVEFRGKGVEAEAYTRPPAWAHAHPETALQTTAITGREDVIMRIDRPVTSAPGQLPPRRRRSKKLVNNRITFNFRQWRP